MHSQPLSATEPLASANPHRQVNTPHGPTTTDRGRAAPELYEIRRRREEAVMRRDRNEEDLVHPMPGCGSPNLVSVLLP